MPAIPSPRGRPPVTDHQRREKRLEVSREAVRLFRAHGVAGVSGRQIAQAAGLSERTLWRLFRTKESCVEPVLSAVVDAVREALRSWTVDVELDEYMRVVTAEQLGPEDTAAALAVVQMSKHEPALRAVWLLLQERTEPVIAEAIAARLGLDAQTPEVRMRAASMNAALRVLADDVAATSERPDDPAGAEEHDAHRARLAEAMRRVARLDPPPGR